MTILFVTDRPPYPPTDGVAVKTFGLIRSLSKRHTVLLLSFCADGAQTSDQLTVLRKFCAAVTFVPLPPRTRRSLVTGVQRVLMPYTCYAAPYQSEEFGIALRRLCSERHVEVIHFDMIYTTPYLKHVPQNCTRIASINDSMTLGFANEALRDASLPGLRRISRLLQLPAISLMERYAYRGFDAVHVVAREDLRVLRALGANPKVVVIPNGVDTEYFAPDDGSVRTDTFRVGYLADFSGAAAFYAKWFIRNVFREVLKEIPAARLSLIGKTPLSPVQNQMKEPGVEWTGTVADVRPHIQRCAVMVSPVMKTCGFLNKIAIGMASGKAVIGWKYNFSAFKHARNHEHYIGVSTTGEFVRTLAEVLGGKIDVDRIGDSACRLVREEYSWESVASQMETMYRRLRINGSGQPNTRGDRVYAHWN